MTTRALLIVSMSLFALAGTARAQVRTGAAALGDWRTDAPGVIRQITAADMPAPYATHPAALPAALVAKPADARLRAPPGFTVSAFAKLDHPRQIRVAPNGDIFVAETDAGRIAVLRAADGAHVPATTSVFAAGLDQPFGIAFWPAGPHPRFVYIANNNSVVRYAYTGGDLKASGAPETVIAKLASSTGGHTTRDVDFTPDGKRMLVSVGSGSNLAEGMPPKTVEEARAWEADHALGSAWGREALRADVLSFDPEGQDETIFATGIRNCVTVRVDPAGGAPWCAVNERDSLGDDLPPDYVTRVKAKGFYGWPWYYIGDHEDPRLKGRRPDLAGRATVPDVLIQPHSAPLGMTFYPAATGAAAFPAAYRGDAFVALHGSWNRSKRTGYKVVVLKVRNGVPEGTYEDFLTGFVASDSGVWGRPVGVAVAHDGALLVTDDGGGMVWRVAYAPKGGAK
ncbi:MAG TPA: PQQ-dependent sugar dehydrogenase [Caulobacteraceae bacterium]|nr:PQQ-dependent sugar dehydrogenase [Caulobacteraceae bacterium]